MVWRKVLIGMLATAPALVFAVVGLAAEVPGLVKDKPASGVAVQTARGFMVPYKEKVPGSDITFEMTPVPGGKFLLGSPESEPGRSPAEGPQVEITVPPFWIAANEVTWAEYRPFMEMFIVFKNFEGKGIRKVTDQNRIDAITVPTELYEPTFTFEFGDDPQLPAVSMTQYAAKQYTKWISLVAGLQYRLPMESEWEYACRGGTTTAYSFGDNPATLGEYARFAGNSDNNGPRKVRQGKPNPFGLYDMHGNAAEWTLDEYFDTGYAYLKGKTDLTPAKAFVMPQREWPRVVRGGSWELDAAACRSSARLASDMVKWKETDPNLPKSPWWMTNDPARGVGFRMVRMLDDIPREEMEKHWGIDLDQLKSDVEFRIIQGRGVFGIVDPDLPKAMNEAK